MGQLSDSYKFINEYIAKYSDATDTALTGNSNRAAASPTTQIQKQAVTSRVSPPVLSKVAKNPIAAMGLDIANQAITQTTQSLITGAAKKFDQAVPIRKAVKSVTDQAFSAIGLASTVSTEVVLELARNNARQVLTALQKKDALISKIRDEIKTLSNLVMIILNSETFFDAFQKDLLKAYDLIALGDQSLKSVVGILKTQKRYNKQLYKRALANLVTARDLILPDHPNPSPALKSARSGNFLTQALHRQSNKDAIQAVLSIPGVSAKLGKYIVEYTKQTVEINALLTNFLSALNDFLSAYQRNDLIDQVTIDHITSATTQLDALLADMKVLLFPTDGREKNYSYPMEVSTSSTSWGLRLATTVEWLNIEPGIASEKLDKTTSSVDAYNRAVKGLNAITQIRYGLATLTATSAQEDATTFAKMGAKLIIVANTAVASNTSPSTPVVANGSPQDIRAKFQQGDNYMQAALTLDTEIRNALTPFVNTVPSTFAVVQKTVSSMIKVFNDLGLDRAAGLLQTAGIKDFFGLTPSTATYVGKAAAEFQNVVGYITSSAVGKSVDDTDSKNLEEAANELNREVDVKNVEAGRRGSNTKQAFIDDSAANLQRKKTLAVLARGSLQQVDPEVGKDPVQEATRLTSIGNKDRFNA